MQLYTWSLSSICTVLAENKAAHSNGKRLLPVASVGQEKQQNLDEWESASHRGLVQLPREILELYRGSIF